MAISSRPPRKPSAWPRTISRRHDAVKLNSALRNTAPSAKPKIEQRRSRRLAVDQHQRDEQRRRQHGGDQERPVETRRARRDGGLQQWRAHRVIVRCDAQLYEPVPASSSAYEPKPSVFFRSSRRVRALATGRLRIGGPFDHRAVVEPHVGPAQHHRQHEPVGRRPVPGVAIGHDRAGGQPAGDLRRADPSDGAGWSPDRRSVALSRLIAPGMCP